MTTCSTFTNSLPFRFPVPFQMAWACCKRIFKWY